MGYIDKDSKRYSKVIEAWANDNIQSISNTLRKRHLKVDLIGMLNSVNNSDIADTKYLIDLVNSQIKKYPILCVKGNLPIYKTIVSIFDVLIEEKVKSRAGIKLYMDSTESLSSLARDESVLDINIWRRLKVTSEATLECKILTNNGWFYSRVSALSESEDVIEIEGEYICSKGFISNLTKGLENRGGVSGRLPRLFLLLNENRIFVEKKDSRFYTDLSSDLSFLDKFKNYKSVYASYPGDIDGSYISDSSISANEKYSEYKMGIVGHTLLLQGCLRQYFNTIDSAETVKRSSDKEIKVHKVNTNIRIQVDDQYINLNELSKKVSYLNKSWKGGHHASPIPHDVSGHWRTYKNGKRVWIKGYHKNSVNYKGDRSALGSKIIVVDS